MNKEVEMRPGHCAAHGPVDAIRRIPAMGFPYVYFAVARAMARRQPYRCPECGQPATA